MSRVPLGWMGAWMWIAAACASAPSSDDASSGASDAATPDGTPADDADVDASRPDASALDASAADGGPADAARTPDAGDTSCGPLDLEAYRGSSCFCGAACDCLLDVPYGDVTWTENGAALRQTIDVYTPRHAPAGASALVLWAHPNGSTKSVGAGSALATTVANPLLGEGMLFASIEFRHPAVNADIGAPRTDLARALQFLRCHATELGFDPARVAAIARSRGTLAVWTAVQDDLAVPGATGVTAQSTRLRGVYGVSAQTSYWGEWIADTFFDAASRSLVLAQIGPDDYGHAVGDVTSDDPPMEIVYDAPLPSLPLAARDCSVLGGSVDCTHLPAFGDALCDAYAGAGIADRCVVRYSVASGRVYDAAPAFLRRVLAP